MQLSTFDLVVPQDLVHKFRENAIRSAFKKHIVRRCHWTHDDIAAPFGLGAPIPVEHVVDTVQRLTPPGKCKYGRIRPHRIVAMGQNDLISDGNATKPPSFAKRLSSGLRAQCERHGKKDNRRSSHIFHSVVWSPIISKFESASSAQSAVKKSLNVEFA